MGSDGTHARRSAGSCLRLICVCGLVRLPSSTGHHAPANEGESGDDDAEHRRLTPPASRITTAAWFWQGTDAHTQIAVDGYEVVDRDCCGVAVILSRDDARRDYTERDHGDESDDSGGESAILHAVCLPSES